MTDYLTWLEALPGPPVFVGDPAGFDFTFVYWYLIRFVGRSPFSFSALDIKTMAMVMLRKEYRQSTKRHMPKRCFDNRAHTHVALDDAIEPFTPGRLDVAQKFLLPQHLYGRERELTQLFELFESAVRGGRAPGGAGAVPRRSAVMRRTDPGTVTPPGDRPGAEPPVADRRLSQQQGGGGAVARRPLA